jgi:HSP20 family protein
MLPTRLRRVRLEDPFEALHGEIDRVFRGWSGEAENGGLGSYPVDIREDKDKIYVEAEVPGFRREEIDVTLENGLLTIQAERRPAESAEGQRSHLLERRYTRIARSFTVPGTVDEQKVEAKLADGVLHLTLHKREEVKPRRIEVK